jgi:hypothetical protein
VLAAALVAIVPVRAYAHDPGSWGGLFRSRDLGSTWFQASQGRLVTSALAFDVSPTAPASLLLGTDSGLLVSRNGGLDWADVDAATFGRNPVFGVVFGADGQHALASTARDLLQSEDGQTWRRAEAPPGSVPARAFVRGDEPGQVYLVGWRGLFRSDDWGSHWTSIDRGLGETPANALVALPGAALVTLSGDIWASDDRGTSWRPRQSGLPRGVIQTLAADRTAESTVWAGGADRIYRSDDRGLNWRQVGQPLPDRDSEIRGIVADPAGAAMLISTHRGVYSSTDTGATWTLVSSNLPGHLEAGPLVAHPAEPSTVYVGFSLLPYDEQWSLAAEGRGATILSELDLVGGAAFLLLLGLGGAVALQVLARSRRTTSEVAR